MQIFLGDCRQHVYDGLTIESKLEQAGGIVCPYFIHFISQQLLSIHDIRIIPPVETYDQPQLLSRHRTKDECNDRRGTTKTALSCDNGQFK